MTTRATDQIIETEICLINAIDHLDNALDEQDIEAENIQVLRTMKRELIDNMNVLYQLRIERLRNGL